MPFCSLCLWHGHDATMAQGVSDVFAGVVCSHVPAAFSYQGPPDPVKHVSFPSEHRACLPVHCCWPQAPGSSQGRKGARGGAEDEEEEDDGARCLVSVIFTMRMPVAWSQLLV